MRRRSLRAAVLSFWLVALAITAEAQGGLRGMGTGFVVAADGFLLTCLHGVVDAEAIDVTIRDNTFQAEVLAENQATDRAVLKMDAEGLAPLPLAEPDRLRVGEEVRAFGFPLASALGTDLKVTRGTVSGISTLDDVEIIQIDAAANPGNSGGPLVNEWGEAVGVISAKLAGEVISNVAFTVPIERAQQLLRANDVPFAQGGSEVRLDGPGLVERVSPSVALIAVTAGPSVLRPTPDRPLKPPELPRGLQTQEMQRFRAVGNRRTSGASSAPSGAGCSIT